ncbi:MAG TPA: GtrA family protein [Bacteroidales bacterium]|nr:GtrA family protein [Bacteroidales bacterium]
MQNILSIGRKTIILIADWFYKPFSRFIPQVTFRYGFTGGLNTALDIFLYFVFYHFVFQKQNLDLFIITLSPHIAAFVFVFPITFFTGFMLAKYVTFTQSTLKGRKQLFRYSLTVTGSILLHYVFLKFFVEFCGFWPTFSKIITTSFSIVYSYFMQKYFSFNIRKPKFEKA